MLYSGQRDTHKLSETRRSVQVARERSRQRGEDVKLSRGRVAQRPCRAQASRLALEVVAESSGDVLSGGCVEQRVCRAEACRVQASRLMLESRRCGDKACRFDTVNHRVGQDQGRAAKYEYVPQIVTFQVSGCTGNSVRDRRASVCVPVPVMVSRATCTSAQTRTLPRPRLG